ncbi:carbohydrate ABC transporter permease [Tenggerimyces flavus]|uniref:Carbohydrate ABC transporter permease n=1 Tax=Tenggerimyces flavus TaxID=1708749 RepID=A0ABV7YJ05_9ACTN|nr:carbohydrate ABC transporter permease [Tenggerimyces flavus]MBM7789657.1 multiple sugar transport system permease protein/putative aldouronate transport system permease protein [Tenggerimyces flavus]
MSAVVLGLFAASVLYPLIYVLSASFSSPDAITSGQMWLWPVDVTTRAYETVFEYQTIVTGFVNSAIYTVGGTAFAVSLTLLAAYPLSRKDLPARNVIMVFFVIPMVFSGGMIPTYLVVRELGMLNTRWALIIPGVVAVWNVIITRTFFQITIPNELLDAAHMDGCSDFRFFLRIVLPLSKPIIAVNALFYGVAQWNSWFNALIYLTNDQLFPLQLVLRQILIQNTVDPSQVQAIAEGNTKEDIRDLLKYAVIVIASLPPLLAYPFVQKQFVRGVRIGSLKG